MQQSNGNKGWLIFLESHFICNLYKDIQQTVQEFIQWHVEEGSVALFCNSQALSLF
jgi:hypothetical protein